MYTRRRDLLIGALRRIGLHAEPPKGTIYLWVPVPEGHTSASFADLVLEDRMAKEGVAVLQSNGMKVHKPSDAELAEFKSVAQKPAIDSIKSQVPQEWIDRAISAVAEAQK